MTSSSELILAAVGGGAVGAAIAALATAWWFRSKIEYLSGLLLERSDRFRVLRVESDNAKAAHESLRARIKKLGDEA